MAKLFDEVVAVLSPYLGTTTSRASVKMHLKDLKRNPDSIEPGDLETLSRKLTPGMKVFVGTDKAEELAVRVSELGKKAKAT
jgi:hypothetical protein